MVGGAQFPAPASFRLAEADRVPAQHERTGRDQQALERRAERADHRQQHREAAEHEQEEVEQPRAHLAVHRAGESRFVCQQPLLDLLERAAFGFTQHGGLRRTSGRHHSHSSPSGYSNAAGVKLGIARSVILPRMPGGYSKKLSLRLDAQQFAAYEGTPPTRPEWTAARAALVGVSAV